MHTIAKGADRCPCIWHSKYSSERSIEWSCALHTLLFIKFLRLGLTRYHWKTWAGWCLLADSFDVFFASLFVGVAVLLVPYFSWNYRYRSSSSTTLLHSLAISVVQLCSSLSICYLRAVIFKCSCYYCSAMRILTLVRCYHTSLFSVSKVDRSNTCWFNSAICSFIPSLS